MERVLQVVPETDLRIKMDALVQDLTQALEETSCPNSSISRVKTGGFRRRTRSAGNLGALLSNRPLHHSDDSAGEKINHRSKEFSSFVQSDSDDMSATSHRVTPYPLNKRLTINGQNPINVESDSVNENFSPLRTGRRKRKMKRIDTDSMELGSSRLVMPRLRTLPIVASVPTTILSLPGPSGVLPTMSSSSTIVCRKKKGSIGSKEPSNRMEGVVGKRKRCGRERNAGTDTNRPCRCCFLSLSTASGKRACHHTHHKHKNVFCGDATMDERELMSSSSLSSSESDPGLYTNDEGREGDDEQSDWFGDSRIDGVETDGDTEDGNLPSLHVPSIDLIPPQSHEGFAGGMPWLGDALDANCDREIRGGRRRVRSERAPFSILTSANEKLSKFLQDGQQLTLRLHAMDVEESEQLLQLVNLYSLQMRMEVSADGESCPVLSKTAATPHAVLQCPEQPNLHAFDYKKRKKMPQSGFLLGGSDMDIA